MSETIYNLYEAKMPLSRLVDRAANGEEIILSKAGKPLGATPDGCLPRAEVAA